MDIAALELDRLNFYRASELHGGLLLGQLVRRVRDPALVLELTRHSAEEVAHAQLWTETIAAVGGTPRPVRHTYQHRYAQAVGTRMGVLEILALTQVFERRVYRHFIRHERLPGTHPEVRRTLRRMVEEEKHHLSWVKRWLGRQAAQRGAEVERVMREYTAIDERIYRELCAEYGFEAEGAAAVVARSARRGRSCPRTPSDGMRIRTTTPKLEPRSRQEREPT